MIQSHLLEARPHLCPRHSQWSCWLSRQLIYLASLEGRRRISMWHGEMSCILLAPLVLSTYRSRSRTLTQRRELSVNDEAVFVLSAHMLVVLDRQLVGNLVRWPPGPPSVAQRQSPYCVLLGLDMQRSLAVVDSRLNPLASGLNATTRVT